MNIIAMWIHIITNAIIIFAIADIIKTLRKKR